MNEEERGKRDGTRKGSGRGRKKGEAEKGREKEERKTETERKRERNAVVARTPTSHMSYTSVLTTIGGVASFLRRFRD